MRRVASALAAFSVLVLSLVTSGAGAAGSGKVIWSGDFAKGIDAWTAIQAKDGDFQVVPAPGRRGLAARFVVHPGDVPIGTSGERSEIYEQTDEQAGVESYWAWSVLFPVGSQTSPNTSWNVFTQWHQTVTGGVQPLSFEITNENGREWIRLRSWGGNVNAPVRRAWRLAPLVRGRWYDFGLRVRWAADNTGLLEVWLNGKEVVPETHTPTLYSGEGVYLKQGFYRLDSAVTSEVYIARTTRGTSLAAIGVTARPRSTKPSTGRNGRTVPNGVFRDTRRPVITGTAALGKVIRTSPGSWSRVVAHLSYQWQWSNDQGRTWMDVRGATRPIFDVTATFVGAKVRVAVTATAAGRTRTATSVPVSPS